MTRTKCRVLDDTGVIAENVNVMINESKDWQGKFELALSIIVESGMSLKLVLEDGRSREILVRQTVVSSNGTGRSISFIGNGPVE